ncbi:MAG: dTMP kinase, partial [Gemmatimonadaceae bacterium]
MTRRGQGAKGGRGGRGSLLVFDGAEGVGKSTQLRRVADRLTAGGRRCLTVREPGGTPVGDDIRGIVLHSAHDLAPAAEALLFIASRAQHVDRVVRPALAEGTIVLCDRFFLATYAYQIVGRGLDEDDVRAANRLATGGLVPDITLVLDLPVEEGLERAKSRAVGGGEGGGGGGPIVWSATSTISTCAYATRTV